MEHSTDSDPALWDRASYEHHPCDDLEPLPDEPNDYRAAALQRLETLKFIYVWLSTASDPRLAWLAVALFYNLTSVRGWSLAAIAKEVGVFRSTLARQKAKFAELLGLDAGGAHLLWGKSVRD